MRVYVSLDSTAFGVEWESGEILSVEVGVGSTLSSFPLQLFL